MTSVAIAPIIRFAKEPMFVLKHLDLALSSADSDTEDNVPFTTSPLDDSRGFAFKKSEVAVRGRYAVKKKTNKKTARRR
jgi:hypothetical protein